jgi:transcription termination factor Rho
VPRRPGEGGIRPLRRDRGAWTGDERDPRRAAAGLPLAEPFRNRMAEQQNQQRGSSGGVPNVPPRNVPAQPGQQSGRGAAPYMPGGRGQRQGREVPPYAPAAGTPPGQGQPGYTPTPYTPYDPYAGYPTGAPGEQRPAGQNRPLRNRAGYGGQQGYPDQRGQRGQQGRVPTGPDSYRENGSHGQPGRGGRLHGNDRRNNDRRGSIGGRPREGRDLGGYGAGLYTGTQAPYGNAPAESRYAPGGRPTTAPAVVRTVDVAGILWLDGGRGLGPAELLDNRTLLPTARLNPEDARRIGLRSGDIVTGRAEERGGRRVIVAVDTVNEQRPEEMQARPVFEQLTASFPDRRIRLEQGPQPVSSRIIDLFAPLGFGSRALIVAPPKTGKTTLIREAAESVLKGYPNAVVMAVLVGERPEEVTDLRSRLEPAGGLVYAASFDEETQRHAWLVQVAVERAKRVAESGRDAFMVLDSLTRLARAENLASRGAGRTLSGGIDAQALDTGRRAFGAARNLEEGGSITILATCLVDTGSRQDDVVYEEFKGTGNMELHLSRELAQRRLFPAVDAVKSGTRREEMLLSPDELRAATALRRRLADLPVQQATQQLLGVMERTPSNAALIQAIEASGWR